MFDLIRLIGKSHFLCGQGPVGLPFVGALSCMSSDLAIKMKDWKAIYGDIISFSLFGKTTIILNSDKVIREALLKRADEFSYRLQDPTTTRLEINDEIFMAPFNDTWKKNKKFALTALKSFGFGTAKSEEKIHAQIDRLEKILLESKGKPINIGDYLMRLSIAVITSIVMNESYEWNDPEAVRLDGLITEFFNCLAGANSSILNIVGTIHPKLASLLGGKHLKILQRRTKDILDYNCAKIEEHRRTLQPEEPRDVIDFYLIERAQDLSLTDEILASNLLLFLPDATDSFTNVVSWLLIHVIHFEDVQKRIHQELDDICGNSRPSLDDRRSLPYTLATISESFRYSTVFSLALPKEMQTDIAFMGYNLPKGSIVIPNIYAAHQDPEVFPEPDKFNPDRFLNADGTFDTQLAGKVITFSVGQRMCPGKLYIEAFTFLLLARILHKFHLKFGPDNETPDLREGKGAFLRRPKHVDIKFQPR